MKYLILISLISLAFSMYILRIIIYLGPILVSISNAQTLINVPHNYKTARFNYSLFKKFNFCLE